MTAAVIWLAVQIFQGDVDLDPDFPPEITRPDRQEDDGNLTDTPPAANDNGGVDPGTSGSPVTSGQAESANPPGSPPAPSPAPPSQPGQPAPAPEPMPEPQPDPGILGPILDAPLLDPLQPVTRPLREAVPLDPVL